MNTQGNEDARQPRVAGVWRMPLHLNVPGTGAFASQIPELPSSHMMVDPPTQCSSLLRFVLGLQEGGRQHIAGGSPQLWSQARDQNSAPPVVICMALGKSL